MELCLSASPPQGPIKINSGTMDSALCIVPPDDAWDVIQRARHLGTPDGPTFDRMTLYFFNIFFHLYYVCKARDATFYTWPPCIRLFHPFVPRHNLTDAATDMAQLIQQLNISSFDITLDQLLILPHFELLEEMEDRTASLPTQLVQPPPSSTSTFRADSNLPRKASRPFTTKDRELEELDQVQQLIRREELKGLKKLQQRLAKASKKGPEESNSESSTSQRHPQQAALSPREVMKQQKQLLQQFNGPCVVCLEPNEDSQRQLHALRQALHTHLFHEYDGFSVSSSVSPHSTFLPRHVLNKYLLENQTDSTASTTTSASFRPTLILGAFSSAHKAVLFAKKLQRLWEPLTFHVSDLHVISRTTTLESSSSPSVSQEYHSQEEIMDKDHDIFMAQGEYGCDAMVMLVGEEWQLSTTEGNDTLNEPHVQNRFFNSWQSYSNKNDIQTPLDDQLQREEEEEEEEEEEKEEEGDTLVMDFTNDSFDKNDRDLLDDTDNRDTHRYYEQEYVQEWLNDDDDWDDGATIIVGRTQFFMGDMRKYIGYVT